MLYLTCALIAIFFFYVTGSGWESIPYGLFAAWFFAAIIKFFVPGTSERVITDSAEAMREFDRIRMEGAKMVGVRLDVQPNAVFTSLSQLAFTDEKYLRSFIRVKRKFKSSAGEARHVVIQMGKQNFDIKISKRNKIVNKNYKIHLFNGGTMADYGSLNIHIKQDGVRCFSGVLHTSNIIVIDGDSTCIARISYLRTPMVWEGILRDPPIAEEQRPFPWYLKVSPGVMKKIRGK